MQPPVITIYSVTVLLNADPDALRRGYSAVDALHYDSRTVLDLDESTPERALSRAFEIGNREGKDNLDRAWSPNVRSISVGDVIHVNYLHITEGGVIKATGCEGYYSVDPIGFTLLDSDPMIAYGTQRMIDAGVAHYAALAR